MKDTTVTVTIGPRRGPRRGANEPPPSKGHRTETIVVAKGGAGRGQVEQVRVTYR